MCKFVVKENIMANFQVNILGCGSATPSMRHMPACQVIDFRDRLFMVDCGEGAQLQMMKQRLKFSRLSHIFISHLHGDHFLGLPGLLSTLALHEKGGTLTIHTFAEGARILQEIMAVFCRETSFEIKYNIIEVGRNVIFEDHAITVETFPLYHRVPCVGFKFTEKPKARHLKGDMIKFFNIPVSRLQDIREGADYVTDDGTVIENARLTTDADPSVSYAYCSDTMFDERVAQDVKGVDLLYHESTYADDFAHKAAPRGHSTAREAGRIARIAGVGRLVLGHYSKAYDSDEPFLKEASEEFPNVITANEGLKIDLL